MMGLPLCRVSSEHVCPDTGREGGPPQPALGTWSGLMGAEHSRAVLSPVPTASQMAILCIFSAVVFALYLAPLTISSPCIMEKKDLGPKPALIGHRGVPMVSVPD